MILQSLYEYYQTLTNSQEGDADVALPNYSSIGISLALELSSDGALLDIIDVTEQVKRGRGMAQVPKKMIVPQRVVRANNIVPNFCWDNGTYMLAISDVDEEEPDFALARFESFRAHNLELLSPLDCLPAKAVCQFLSSFEQAKIKKHPKVIEHTDQILKGVNLVFMFEGCYVHDNELVRQAWEISRQRHMNENQSQCLVTGRMAPIARIHGKIKGLPGASGMGVSLVSFNFKAAESYGLQQGDIAPISEAVAHGYQTALNHLLANRKFVELNGTAYCFWSNAGPEMDGVYARTFRHFIDDRLDDAASGIRLGWDVDVSDLSSANPQPEFFVLGLKAGKGRGSVRFFEKGLFRTFVERIGKHYDALSIVKEYEEDKPPSVFRMLRAIFPHDIPPNLTDEMLRSIFYDIRYPQQLLGAVLERIRVSSKVRYIHTSILKAYLLRSYRQDPTNKIHEVLRMSLNSDTDHPAYVLGRLFAVLEALQKSAAKGRHIGTNVRTRYYASASTTPGVVFPTLMQLAAYHVKQSRFGSFYDRMIQEIAGKLSGFPVRLSLDDQGAFSLGYYHQRVAIYTKKTNDAAGVIPDEEIDNLDKEDETKE